MEEEVDKEAIVLAKETGLDVFPDFMAGKMSPSLQQFVSYYKTVNSPVFML